MKKAGEEDNNVADENIVEPVVLYKYYEFKEYTEKIFTHNEIYFSSPNDFNDPFDSKPHLACDGNTQQIEDYLCARYGQKHSDRSKKEILADVRREIMAKGKEKIVLEEAVERARELLEKSLVSVALLEIRDNILMWAHYAKQHSGFCLEFNVNNDFFRPLMRAIDVKYDESRPELNVLGLDSYPEGKVGEILLVKAKNWQYEQEWRIVNYEKDERIQNYPEDALSGVILGCRISHENKENVFRWCRKRKHPPSLYEARENRRNLD